MMRVLFLSMKKNFFLRLKGYIFGCAKQDKVYF